MNVYVQIGFSQYLEGCTSKIISALRRGAFQYGHIRTIYSIIDLKIMGIYLYHSHGILSLSMSWDFIINDVMGFLSLSMYRDFIINKVMGFLSLSM